MDGTERNGTDGATARFVTFGFGREKRANDDDVDGDDEATTTREGRRFTRRFIDSSIHSFVRSFALGVFLALARASGGFARDDDDDDGWWWWWFAASSGERRLETRVRTSRVRAGLERR